MMSRVHCPRCASILARWDDRGALALELPAMATQSLSGAWLVCPCGGQQVLPGARVTIREEA